MTARAGRLDRNSEISRLGLSFDIMAEAVAERELELRAGKERWHAIFQSMHEGFALCEMVYGTNGEASDYRYLELNDAWERMTGISNAETLGLTARKVFAGIDELWIQTFARVVETGEPAHFERQISLTGRWYDVVAYRTEPHRFAALFLDVTQRRAAEQRQALLAREVDHRAKNVLTVVQAALRLTKAPDVASYRNAIEGRVTALARAQSVLARVHWTEADLHWLLEEELSPFLGNPPGSGTCVQLDGPSVAIPAMAVQPMAMIIHELATNAMKFGALSVSMGRLSVSWHLVAGYSEVPLLRLHWIEARGPRIVAPPARRRFGSRLLDGTVRRQLGGKVSFAWEASGLVCEIEIPFREGTDPTARKP
jgi:two-component sensor histidine kinase